MTGLSDRDEANKASERNSACYMRAYDETSKYVIRELNLINNRLTWILTIHGFLYATYGFALDNLLNYLKGYGKVCGDLSLVEAFRLDAFMAVITLVGICISVAGVSSINAACDAMQALENAFFESHKGLHERSRVAQIQRRKLLRKEKVSEDVEWYVTAFDYRLPPLLGGGLASANKRGNSASRAIPWILFASWAVSIIVLALSNLIFILSRCYADQTSFPELRRFFI